MYCRVCLKVPLQLIFRVGRLSLLGVVCVILSHHLQVCTWLRVLSAHHHYVRQNDPILTVENPDNMQTRLLACKFTLTSFYANFAAILFKGKVKYKVD